jgi:excisionase family DNA binding protein
MPIPTTVTALDHTDTGKTSRLLTSDQVARFLGCTPRHIFNLRKRGLPAYRIGKIVRFDIEQVKCWLDHSDDISSAGHTRQLRGPQKSP